MSDIDTAPAANTTGAPASPFAPLGEEDAAPAPTAAAGGASSGQSVLDVPVDVQVVLGHARMTVDRVMKLGRGAVVEIERRVGEAVEVCVNDHLVARGEVVIVDGDKLGVALTEVVGTPGA